MKVGWRFLVLVVIAGICTSFVSGFVENKPEASVLEHRYYGWPLVWRITTLFEGEMYRYFELFADCLFWIAIVFVVALLTKKLTKTKE